MIFQKLLAQIQNLESELNIPFTDAPGDETETQLLEIFFAVASVVAMLVIVIAGLQFILSRGDPQKAATARSAIIYAAIGLALAVSAFSIVRYVVGAV